MTVSHKTFYKPQTYRLEDSIVFLMVRNQLIFERIADQRLDKFGISASQMRVLMLIDQLNQPTASQISTMMGSHAAATVRTLDRLEKKMWIKRTRSSDDRRVVHLSVTPKAKEILVKIPPHLCNMLNDSLRGISEEEFKTVKKVLVKIAENNLQFLESSQSE